MPLFREPRATRAKRTELLLGVILGVMLLGLAVLAKRWHVGPRSGQTVLSQIMALAVGRGWAYYIVSLTITVVLALAANTSFGGLPVLSSLLARDNYVPHLFALRGDRQTFAFGIGVLSVMSGVLLLAVRGNTNTLIPLFAIGVFTGFTLSQTGLVVHWRRLRPRHWQYRAAINGTGAVITAVATIVFLVSKFTEGAWVVVVAVPAFILLFLRIHAYYVRAAADLRIDQVPPKPIGKRTIVIVPVNRLSRLTAHALTEAKSLGQEVVAVTVVLETGDDGDRWAQTLVDQWSDWDPGVPLRVLRTDYASVVEPTVEFIDAVRADHPHDQVVVLIPVVRPNRARYRLLHNQIDLALSSTLRKRDDIVVARVSVPLEPSAGPEAASTGSAATVPAAAPAAATNEPGENGPEDSGR